MNEDLQTTKPCDPNHMNATWSRRFSGIASINDRLQRVEKWYLICDGCGDVIDEYYQTVQWPPPSPPDNIPPQENNP